MPKRLAMNTPLIAELERLGAPRSNIRLLDDPSPKNIPYLDLVRGVNVSWDAKRRIRPQAVVEFERKPILYIIDGGSLAEGASEQSLEIASLRAKLASRGDPAWMAVRTPGRLTIYSLGFGDLLPDGIAIEHGPGERRTFIQDLAFNGWEALDSAPPRGRASTRQAFHAVSYTHLTLPTILRV